MIINSLNDYQNICEKIQYYKSEKHLVDCVFDVTMRYSPKKKQCSSLGGCAAAAETKEAKVKSVKIILILLIYSMNIN